MFNLRGASPETDGKRTKGGMMKIQCHVFVAMSLDGYIAREDGQIDWLEQYNAILPKGEDCGK